MDTFSKISALSLFLAEFLITVITDRNWQNITCTKNVHNIRSQMKQGGSGVKG